MIQLRSIPTQAVVVTAMILHAVPTAPKWLEYHRGAILNGEIWRLFTGQLIHISVAHLFSNCAMILIAGGLIERCSRRQLQLTIVFSLLAVGPLLLLFDSNLATYAGLSGIAAASIASIVTTHLIGPGRCSWLWPMIALLLLGKLVYESIDPTLLLAASPSSIYRSVPLAHLLGTVAGISAALVCHSGHPQFTRLQMPTSVSDRCP